MNDKEEWAFLACPKSKKEEEATAISSVRKGGASSPKTANPGIKYWGTNFGKEMMMGGKDLSFTAKEGSVFLSLHEDQGIMFQSEFPIVVATEQNLELQADKKIKITAQEGVYLVSDTSSVMLDGETHLQAPMIKMEGTYKAPVVVEDLPEEAVEEEVVEEEESNSFLDNLQLGLEGIILQLIFIRIG
ncbi:hypothetical protein [Brevibacillus sp. SYSU BS000544]|uniref:hypothetical protein n=1 Tax=Brevibacillus sp. SYSU BS000544 TaxID=3416443 RepID=UPI003CE5481B